MNTAFVHVLFRFVSGVLEQDTTETLWAVPVDAAQGIYRLNSIPFYAPMVAYEDVILAEYDAVADMLVFREIVQSSGNSTIHVMMTDPSGNEQTVRETFRNMGCRADGSNTGYFAIAVPEDIDYIPIKLKLEQLSGHGVLDYAEACLSSGHQYS